MPLLSVIDHLVYATPDLDAAVEQVENLVGVRAEIGGQHPIWGTKNALLALGSKIYLEIIGPDPSLPKPNQARPFGIDQLVKPRLVTWVARSDNLQATIEIARRYQLDLGVIQERNRRKPDGTVFSWSMTDLMKNRKDGLIPYFINWGDSPHPAGSSPKGCSLIKLEGFHPDNDEVNELLKSLGLDFVVQRGSVAIKATIECPKGQVVL